MKRILFFILVLYSVDALGQAESFKSLRYDENYDYLRTDTSLNWYDKLKFKPVNFKKSVYLSIGGEVRYQYFWFKNQDWGEASARDDGFILTRFLAHTDFQAGKYFRTFFQLQSGFANGMKEDPSPVDENQLDIHQAFIEGKLISTKRIKLSSRIGRQELSYGSQRLVSVRESPNNRQAFDAAKIMISGTGFSADGFYGNYVQAKPDMFDDVFTRNTKLWGLYTTVKKIAVINNADFYYLGISRKNSSLDEGKGKQTRHSIGTRIFNAGEKWMYDLESIYQFGHFNEDKISAWTVSLNTSYSFKNLPGKPEFGIKSEIVSGDRDYSDGKLNTFDPMFPKGAYFGQAALIGPSNLIDLHPYLGITLSEKLTWSTDYDIFWRQSTNDGIYAINTSLIYSGRNSLSKRVGRQLETMLEYTPNKFIYLRGEFTWFHSGQFLKDVGPGRDILMSSATVQFKF